MYRNQIRRAAVTVGVLVTTVAVAGPAAAILHPGPAPAILAAEAAAAATVPRHCMLERVEAQLVRCDDLTGNGVTAPWYIPKR
jgi:hypothetical protein